MSTQDISLVIIDTNAYLHALNYRLATSSALRTEIDAVLRFNTLYLLSGAYLENFGVKKFQVVFASDLKLVPYWRLHHLFVFHDVNYKASRGKDPVRSQEIYNLQTKLREILISKGKLPLHMYAKQKIDGVTVGYEADDVASGIVQTLSPQYEHTYLLTDDSDWLGLVSDNVTWCGIRHYLPRVRTPKTAMDWIQANKTFASTKARREFQWQSHKDIWKYKALFGDISDGITGDKDVTKYLPYIDLFNPVSDFRIWDEPTFQEKINYCLFDPRQPITMQMIREKSKSIPLFMNEYNMASTS